MKPIRMDPKRMSLEKYWETACNSCKNKNDAEYCGACFTTLSEMRKKGEPFYLL